MKFDYSKKYYKVINSNYGNPSYIIYHKGVVNVNESVTDIGENSGIYFTDIKHIFSYFRYGNYICELTIPKSSKVVYSPEQMHLHVYDTPGWYADEVIVEDIYDNISIDTIEKLISLGADVTVDNYQLFKWALTYNHFIFDWLTVHYEDIIINNSEEIFK